MLQRTCPTGDYEEYYRSNKSTTVHDYDLNKKRERKYNTAMGRSSKSYDSSARACYGNISEARDDAVRTSTQCTKGGK